jgi:hypothetical protein
MTLQLIAITPTQFAANVSHDFQQQSEQQHEPPSKRQNIKLDQLLLRVDEKELPADYVHAPTNMATATPEQIERQCAIPLPVMRICSYWSQAAHRYDQQTRVKQEERTNTTVTYLLNKQFPFDQDAVVRRLAKGDPFAEQRLRNEFQAAQLLGTRLHCYIEVFLPTSFHAHLPTLRFVSF